MHIETLHLDRFANNDVFRTELSAIEQRGGGPVFLESALDNFDRIRESLLALRASNLSAILRLKPTEGLPAPEELEAVVCYLRDWDQLFLHNILVLFQGWIPEKFIKELEAEARIETKWFQEWLSANQDQRLSRYPGLPWRSYIRKVIGENFDFVLTLLKVGTPGDRDEMTLENLLRAYLKSRKKAICFFPKKWGKTQ